MSTKLGRNITLPQLRSSTGCGKVRPSTRSRWRALCLILVHVAAAIHIAQWYATGSTLTPVEPSEAMQTLGQGLVNAGFILFALLILSTLIVGRFFCGWACHLVALQDLCSWLLGKVGIRPKQFQSRLLVFVPLGAALFMFVAPSLVRIWMGQPRPEFSAHLTTDNFWDRFPGLAVSLLTFAVCGFVIVYLLGNKGFCTYACPYGGIFGLADYVAPGRIRVTDACEGCGHCTAACTSNVRVHQEVGQFGMVVDPGCMKCLDCVSVCPKDALYFGLGRPSLTKGPARAAVKAQKPQHTWAEEIVLGVLFVVSVVIMRALYGAVPFLLALGLAAIGAYLLLTAGRLFYAKNVRMTGYQLRTGGKTTPAGTAVFVLAALWLIFVVHSGVVQYMTIQGQRHLDAALAGQENTGLAEESSSADRFRTALKYLNRADQLGLFQVASLHARLAGAHSHLGDHLNAEHHFGRAVALGPKFASARYELYRYANARNDTESAVAHLRAILEFAPDYQAAHGELADLLIGSDRAGEAVEMLQGLIQRKPHHAAFQITLGLALAHAGNPQDGIETTRQVLTEHPDHPDALFNLGLLLANQKQLEEALKCFERTTELVSPQIKVYAYCAKTSMALADWDKARHYLEESIAIEPFNAALLSQWCGVLRQTGALGEAIQEAERTPEPDRAGRYRLMFLYRAAGRTDEADALGQQLKAGAGG